ncbi:MAG TPA: hypothetical protein PKL67_08395 [Anaerolineae bacterium]|nr:hypothetical protein [Anaerolineae bacterium]
MWPLATPAHALTAAQAILLAEALAPDKEPARGKGKKGGKATAEMNQPRVSRKVLEALALRDDPGVQVER